MCVAGNDLVWIEIPQEVVEQREKPARLGWVGPRFVIVTSQQQRDGDAAHSVGHDRRRRVRIVIRQFETELSKMLLDRETDRRFESASRQDMARVAGFRQPSHDGQEALGYAGGRVADAVVVNQ